MTLLNFNKTNSHTPKIEIQSRQRLCYFGRYVAKAKLFCPKIFVPVTRAGVFIWENFHPGYPDLGCKTRDLSNWASPGCPMNTSKFYEGKSGEARSRKPSQPS